MGVGYLFGCLLSILFWKIDRHNIFARAHERINRKIVNKIILQMMYLIFIAFFSLIIWIIPKSEMINAIVAFSVIEISNSERKTIIRKSGEKKEFYNTLSIISKSFISGFLAPMIYIIILGNMGGIIYTLIYYASDDEELKFMNSILNFINIIPTIIGGAFLYFIYVIRNKTFKINFKGDFFVNLFENPLLNIYVLAAYAESVNFYYYKEVNGVHYLKSYGIYQEKIDDICVKDFLTIIYGICIVTYMCFWFYMVTFGEIFN